MVRDQEINDLEGIAIIGMAGRFPGAKNVAEFWQNLCDGVESISFFSDEELIASGVDQTLVHKPNYVKARGVLGDTEFIDATFFGLHPREAALMDPQHRLFLECAWEAFESAGYSPDNHEARVGVFAGQSMNTYLLTNVSSQVDLVQSVESLQASIGNDKDSLTTEVAYRMSLTGPAVTIQSSSSTSLVAVHYACQSLLGYECGMALAGGACIHFPEKAGYLYHEGGTTSSDGHCRAFDARADGFVAGHGVAVVVLKRLEDALADGDTIHAVIKGSAVNNDGSVKVSYMAPSVDGQADVIAMAQAIAGVEPEDIGYVEAHGTGTLIGDPIEVTALTQAFRAGTDKKGFCAIGSVKPNVGHLDAAAGVAGLIKAALVLKHKMIPPLLHFEQPNPNLDLANSPFCVHTRLAEWETNGKPRLAGVSSFGMGGTNAHAVLEEMPAIEPSGPSRPAQLLLLSAKTESALETMTTGLADHLRQHPRLNLPDVAYTLQVGRKRFGYRRMLVCHDLDDAREALSTGDPERILTSFQEPKSRPVMFMFSGQGSQYVNMGRELYEQETIFREHIDACVELLRPHLGLDLRDVLYPPEERAEKASAQLAQTALTQPALFAIEYALARLWMSWGIQPQAMIGHSIGEYVAACLAGVLSLEHALALVAVRGRLMQQMPAGAMLAVSLSEQDARPFLDTQLSLAVVNGPSNCVVSGTDEAIDGLQRRLEKDEVECRRLHTSHAFHSAMMEPALPSFREQVQRVRLDPPTMPYVSNVTGTWITAEEATDPDYWVQHLRQTVRFSAGVRELLQDPDAILLEVGPGKTLSTLARLHVDRNTAQVAIPSLRHPRERQSDVAFLLNSIGRLWLAGVDVDWSVFYAAEWRHRIPLPTYPFERSRHWIEPREGQVYGQRAQAALVDQKLDVANWFYFPSWKRTLAPERDGLVDKKIRWLLFVNGPGDGLGDRMAQRLVREGQDVVTVGAGAHFARLDEQHFAIHPKKQTDYESLLKELDSQGKLPDRVVQLWNVTPTDEVRSGAGSFDAFQELGFYSLLFLAQALTSQNVTTPLHVTVVTDNVQQVAGTEVVSPEKATVLGACKVIPQEYPNIVCKSIDLVLPEPGSWQEARLVDHLLAECASDPTADGVIAYRGQHRWAQTFESIRLDEAEPGQTCLREQGVYLITGGLGDIGFVLAEALARSVHASLILVGRSRLPGREEWERWLGTHDEHDATSRKMRRVQALEELGVQVMVASADVADRKQMRDVIERAKTRFGTIHGVIHAAGTVDAALFRAMKDTKPADAQGHFRVKVQGLYVLEDVLRGHPLDFCLLVSSLASVLGGLGLGAYAAANGFMDAFAHRHNQSEPVPWLSVNWDAWQPTAAKYADVGFPFAELSITPVEGAEAFQRMLTLARGAVTQVLVSTSHLQARIEQWLASPESSSDAGGAAGAETTAHVPRPNLQNAYVAPRNEVEREIVEVWQEVLGIRQVGVYDNFFELGGNSLAGVQLIAQLKEALGIQVPVVSLYEGPTVNTLAKIIIQIRGDGADGDAAHEADRTRGQRQREKLRRRRRG